jgi:hypothetical protein
MNEPNLMALECSCPNESVTLFLPIKRVAPLLCPFAAAKLGVLEALGLWSRLLVPLPLPLLLNSDCDLMFFMEIALTPLLTPLLTRDRLRFPI